MSFTYTSNATIAQIAKRVLAGNRILITTHTKPDGDAMGSVLALARALQAKDKLADVFLMGPIESNLITIAGRTPFRLVDREPPGDAYDLAIVVDTGSWSQLESLADWLRVRHSMVVSIDHHPHGDDIASMRLVQPDAVSTTAIVAPLLGEMGCELTGGVGGVAEALFVGLATDSGWFRYANAGAEAFALAAKLLACGVDKPRLFQILEETYGPQRLALEARALASVEFVSNGSVAIQTLRLVDFQETGAAPEDLTGLVNTPLSVGQVRVSILISQNSPGVTKLSFRSKPALPDSMIPGDGQRSEVVDVNVLAQRFGGGGHVHAAGARVKMDVEAARAAIVRELA